MSTYYCFTHASLYSLLTVRQPDRVIIGPVTCPVRVCVCARIELHVLQCGSCPSSKTRSGDNLIIKVLLFFLSFSPPSSFRSLRQRADGGRDVTRCHRLVCVRWCVCTRARPPAQCVGVNCLLQVRHGLAPPTRCWCGRIKC